MRDYTKIDLPPMSNPVCIDCNRFVDPDAKEKKSYRKLAVVTIIAVPIFVLSFALLLIFNSFKIININVIGNEYYSETEIVAVGEVFVGARYLSINEKNAAANIKKAYPRVGKVIVDRIFPNTVNIIIEEAAVGYYTAYNGLWYSLTENLYAVEESKLEERFKNDNLIYINFPEILSVKIGESLEFEKIKYNTDYIAQFMTAMADMDLGEKIIAYDLSDKFDLTVVFENGSCLSIGNISDLDNKLDAAKIIFQNIRTETEHPVLVNVSDLTRPWYKNTLVTAY